MKPCNGFIVGIFLTAFVLPEKSFAQSGDCRKMDIQVEIEHSTNGKAGTIRVTSDDRNLEFTLHLLTTGGASRRNEQMKITTRTVKDVPPGTYDLVIHSVDGTYCSETRKVTVN